MSRPERRLDDFDLLTVIGAAVATDKQWERFERGIENGPGDIMREVERRFAETSPEERLGIAQEVDALAESCA